MILVLATGCSVLPFRESAPPSRPIATAESGQAASLLGEVGTRTREAPHLFALRLLDSLGVRLPPRLWGAADGAALVAELGDRVERNTRPLPGDLVVFEGGWLVAVVTGVRDDGTVEFVYVQRKVVRRGLVNPAYPSVKRDRQGRALNTFIRAYQDGDRSDQRYLAGEALTGFVRLDRLVR